MKEQVNYEYLLEYIRIIQKIRLLFILPQNTPEKTRFLAEHGEQLIDIYNEAISGINICEYEFIFDGRQCFEIDLKDLMQFKIFEAKKKYVAESGLLLLRHAMTGHPTVRYRSGKGELGRALLQASLK